MLSNEQRKIIEESMWIVNTVLRDIKQSFNEDLRQDAALYMCRCIERFDASRGVKWSTYAYKNVSLYVKKRYERQLQKTAAKRKYEVKLEAAEHMKTCTAEDDDKMAALKNICTDEENLILELLRRGYRQYEIAAQLGCRIITVSLLLKGIKTKAKSLKERRHDRE